MMRMFAVALAALVLVASPVWAQTVTATQIENLADQTNADLDQAVDTAAFTADMQQMILDAYNATHDPDAVSLDALSDQDLADTVKAMLEANPDLAEKHVTAIVRAAVRAKPTAAPLIIAGAILARPGLEDAIRGAAADALADNGEFDGDGSDGDEASDE